MRAGQKLIEALARVVRVRRLRLRLRIASEDARGATEVVWSLQVAPVPSPGRRAAGRCPIARTRANPRVHARPSPSGTSNGSKVGPGRSRSSEPGPLRPREAHEARQSPRRQSCLARWCDGTCFPRAELATWCDVLRARSFGESRKERPACIDDPAEHTRVHTRLGRTVSCTSRTLNQGPEFAPERFPE